MRGGKTFRFTCKSLRQFSLVSKSWLIDTPGNQEADALAQVRAPASEPSGDTADGLQRKSGHRSARVQWCIVKDARLPLNYCDSLNSVTACPVCSKQPKAPAKGVRAIHGSSQKLRDRQIHYIDPLPLSEDSKYA